jgi:hypothetical protein
VKKETVEVPGKPALAPYTSAPGLQIFTETPMDADLAVDKNGLTPGEVAQEIFSHLQGEGFIAANGSDAGT